tara:strand:- start:1093 stop:2085 length:993 start_codon:yes stop_codon:yes gene_type:complete
MTFYSAMVNAWALAASILDGTFDEDYPIMTTDDDKNRVTPQESDEYDPPKSKRDPSQDFWIEDGISVTGNPNPSPDTIHIDTNIDFDSVTITGGADAIGAADTVQFDYGALGYGSDQLSFSSTDESEQWVKDHGGYEWTPGSAWPPNDEPGPFPSDPLSDNDDQIAHLIPTTPEVFGNDYTMKQLENDKKYQDAMMPGIEEEKRKWIYESPDGGKTVYRHELGKDPLKRELVPQENNQDDIEFKYNEDVTLKEVEEYVKSTYKSHYANDNKTQTLDLINSIGDAESFSKANAIKYLSRFGKKDGKSKFDILKAIHYCILLYHFSGLHNDN